MLPTTNIWCSNIYWAFRWQRHSETSAISILCSKQAVSLFFPMFKCSKKRTFSFLLHNHVCISIMLWFQEGIHPEIACGSRGSMQHRTFEAFLQTNLYLFLERCRKSSNICLCALMQSDCLYSSLFFEHYNRILLCDWVLGRYSVNLSTCAGHNAFLLHLALTRVGHLPCDFRDLPWM